MPDVTVKRVEDFEAIFGGGFRRARAGLGVSSFGLAVIDLPPNFSRFPAHDQTHDDQEEVYTVISGKATLQVGGQEWELEPGVFARVGAIEKRKLVTGDEPARIIAMGAMPGRVYEPPEFTNEGTKPPSLDKIGHKDPSPAL
jgi:Cupin domain